MKDAISYLLYINDLPLVSNLFMPIMFANDTNLFCNEPYRNERIEESNEEMKLIYALIYIYIYWKKVNKFLLNIEMKETVLIDYHPITNMSY